MTDALIKRPHFKNPPIYEQAISIGFERLTAFSIVDPGLFWTHLRDEFPIVESGPRLPITTEWFEGPDAQSTLTLSPAVPLPKTVYKTPDAGELIQLQDDKFVFNWVRASENAQYPRFEQTSARTYSLFARWSDFVAERHGKAPQIRQCELTNVNVVPVKEFGADFDDMNRAFKVDPFAWDVPGLVAETYVRQRVHRMVDESMNSIGRLHSVISPVFLESGEKAFHFEITARSAPNIGTLDEARDFFNRGHDMINGAFLASVTNYMREVWGEKTDG
jgi:uncharacterized protein (TIGR04255 family)